LKEVFDIQKKIDSTKSEILSLREWVDRGCFENLALECEL